MSNNQASIISHFAPRALSRLTLAHSGTYHSRYTPIQIIPSVALVPPTVPATHAPMHHPFILNLLQLSYCRHCFVHTPSTYHAVNDRNTGDCSTTVVKMFGIQAFIPTPSLVIRVVSLGDDSGPWWRTELKEGRLTESQE